MERRPVSAATGSGVTSLCMRRDGATLRGVARGTGPAVLLLHAGGECRSVWDPLLPDLAASGLRAVAYDLRGHGESTGQATSLEPLAADVAAMLAHERGPAVVVGASLGGFAALAALAEESTANGVDGVVLVDVVPDPAPGPVRAWLDGRGMLRDRTALVEDILGHGPHLLAIAAGLEMPILLVRGGRSAIADGDVERLRRASALGSPSRLWRAPVTSSRATPRPTSPRSSPNMPRGGSRPTQSSSVRSGCNARSAQND